MEQAQEVEAPRSTVASPERHPGRGSNFAIGADSSGNEDEMEIEEYV